MTEPLVCACRTFELPNGYGLYEDGFIHTVDCCPVVRLRDMVPATTSPTTPSDAALAIITRHLAGTTSVVRNYDDAYRRACAVLETKGLPVRVGKVVSEDNHRLAHAIAIEFAATTSPETPEPLEFRTTKEAMEYAARHEMPSVIPVAAPVPAAGADEGDYRAGVEDACKAICSCCADTDKWGKAAHIEGSTRFWHGDYPCDATPIRTALAAALRSGEGEGK